MLISYKYYIIFLLIFFLFPFEIMSQTQLDSSDINDVLNKIFDSAPEQRLLLKDKLLIYSENIYLESIKMLEPEVASKPGEMVSILERISKENENIKGNLPQNFDLLDALLKIDPLPAPVKVYKDVVVIVLNLRILSKSNSDESYEEIIKFAPKYRGMFRNEIIRNCTSIGDEILPDLILNSTSQDKVILQVVKSCIRNIKRTTISDQVRVNNEILARVLQSYAQTKDASKIDLILSFTDHNSKIVRDAARKSVYSFTYYALWPLRKKYENFTGKEAPNNWNWEEVAKNLFDEQDKNSNIRYLDLFEKGTGFAKNKQWDKMYSAFEELLRKAPEFYNKNEIASYYLNYASFLIDEGDIKKGNDILFLSFLLSDDISQKTKIKNKLDKLELLSNYKNGVFVPLQWQEVINKNDDSELKTLFSSTKKSLSYNTLLLNRRIGFAVAFLIGIISFIIIFFFRRAKKC